MHASLSYLCVFNAFYLNGIMLQYFSGFVPANTAQSAVVAQKYFYCPLQLLILEAFAIPTKNQIRPYLPQAIPLRFHLAFQISKFTHCIINQPVSDWEKWAAVIDDDTNLKASSEGCCKI